MGTCVYVDWDAYSREDYLGHSTKPDDAYLEFFQNLGKLCHDNVTNPMQAYSNLRHLVDEFGADAADEAVNILLGSETATGLIEEFDNKPAWTSDDYWYETGIVANVEYMASNYNARECRSEMEDGMLGYIWQSEDEGKYPNVRNAVDGFCEMFFGNDFKTLFSMV